MALIVSRKKAKESPCTCYYIGDKKLDFPIEFSGSLEDAGIDPEDVICFSKGAIGALTNVEDIEFCGEGVIHHSKRLKERLSCMSKCAKKC